jgi:large conductance mechanosensitive channel
MAQSEQTKITENKDGSIKVTQPGGKKHHVTVLLEPDDLVREQATGFANFLREYAVVGLAIGFIVGQQANAVVKQLVASFVEPFIQVLFGKDWNHRVATVHHGGEPIQIAWGVFLYTLIEFFFVVIAIYIVIKLFRLDKLKTPKDDKPKKGKKK